MCGINGFISSALSVDQRTDVVSKMNSQLAHRGPDNDGVWSEDQITLGHRRLSIIDLSVESNQPFFSSDQRYCIVYNGELYNYRELKLELQRSAMGSNETPFFFKTVSDTEVVLSAFIRWGTKCLDKFNGMFAFAIYDREQKKVFAARDPLGVKPFYYSFGENGFLFSSEMRAILASGVRSFSLNRSALPEYTMYQTVFAPATIIKEIKVLMPGHYLEFSDQKATVSCYYDINKLQESPDISYEEACTEVRNLLAASVQRRLVADVPFGAFLSGGIDSSAVVALMTEVSTEKVKTFNVSFDEGEFSESQYAKLIAKKYNTEHHEIKLSPADFLQQLPEALAAMDHPGGDGPNTYIVSKATRKAGVTMALSGIGGDELFAGYDVFKRINRINEKSWMNAVPLLLRKTAGATMSLRKPSIANKKIAELLSLPTINFESVYPLIRSLFTESDLKKIIGGDSRIEINKIISCVPQFENQLLTAVSLAEINTYLKNVLLRDADQMGMAVAFEIREPFLDKHLLNFVLSLHDKVKFPHTPKKLLTDSLGNLLPSEIVNRKKMGFTLPWQQWLRKDLKDFVDIQIQEIEHRNIYESGVVSKIWQNYLKGDPTITWSRIWHIAVLNDWMKKNGIN